MAHTPSQADRPRDASRARLAKASLAGLTVLALVLAGCTSSQAGTPTPTATATGTTSAPPTQDPTVTGTTTATPPTTTGPPSLPPSATAKPKPPVVPRTDLGPVALGTSIVKEGECPCPPMRFQLDPTAPAEKASWLELRVSWDGERTAGLKPSLVPPGGNASLPAKRGFDDRRIQSFSPAAGEYALDLAGTGAYTLEIRFLSLAERRSTGAELLPNVVTTIPIDIHMGPCDPIETSEQGATRCLRLANGIANTGDGPLEVHLMFDRALFALNPLTEGAFVQWLYKPDRTHTEHESGPATFHMSHRHWHYAELANFALHPYDPETGLRSPAVASHHKQGFCFLDWAKMNATDVDPSGGSNAQQNCQIPGDTGWTMGISRGYYDYYEARLTDQYVDVKGVPDGTYELVSTADRGRSLIELDPTDNSASVIIELHGESVTLLEERGHYVPLEYAYARHP